jgi:hypothetical protein
MRQRLIQFPALTPRCPAASTQSGFGNYPVVLQAVFHSGEGLEETQIS